MPPKVWTSGACYACRYDVLEAFAALAGLTLRSSPRPRALPRSSESPIWAVASSRRFSNQPFLKVSAEARQSEEPKQSSSQEDTDQTFSQPATPPSTTQSIPWYLQIDPPTPPAPSNPLFASQIIPTLPADAPTILSPIVTYLADTAGLDNISILDLRHLDPPPALGANLIMLIGTARSVKHLNVSADRFARWCRSNYKLRPYADGLLGRNELKLKLRRKARRQKLAQSVGNTVDAGRDDGITTGWICVNVGPVDEVVDGDPEQGAHLEKQGIDERDELPTEDGYAGFGRRSAAPRIVVQMFTEEKRLEVDLEGLWDVRSTRRARKNDKANTAAEQSSDIRDVWAEGTAQTDAEIESPSAREAVDESRSVGAGATS